MYQYSFIKELVIDNFAGGGGASTGIELAIGSPVDIAINHDPDAINENLKERIKQYKNDCRKISADVYIDDRAYNVKCCNNKKTVGVKADGRS